MKRLVDTLRTKAWCHSFINELQLSANDFSKLEAADASRITLQVILNEIPSIANQSALNSIYTGEIPASYKAQFSRWLNGKQTIASTNPLVGLFAFPETVYSTGIPQTPCDYNIRFPDSDFASSPINQKQLGKAFVFDFYDTPPLWTSIKGTPKEILNAWREVTKRAWLLWFSDDPGEHHGTNFHDRKWLKLANHDTAYLRDEIALARALEIMLDNPLPPIVCLTAGIAAARLVENDHTFFGNMFESKELARELMPYRLRPDDFWDALEELGCPPIAI